MPLPSSQLSGERMAKTPALAPHNFVREGLYSYTSLSGAHPHSDEPAVEADEGVVLLHEGRSGLGSETSNGSDESESSFVGRCFRVA